MMKDLGVCLCMPPTTTGSCGLALRLHLVAGSLGAVGMGHSWFLFEQKEGGLHDCASHNKYRKEKETSIPAFLLVLPLGTHSSECTDTPLVPNRGWRTEWGRRAKDLSNLDKIHNSAGLPMSPGGDMVLFLSWNYFWGFT